MTRSPWEHRREALVSNLLDVYGSASESAMVAGMAWYPKARTIVQEWSNSYQLHVVTVASVIAALSPQCEWSRNLIIADDVLADRAISIGGALQKNLRKARQLRAENTGRWESLALTFPYGPKVNSFAANLAGDDHMVTVDTHGVQAACNDATSTLTLNWTRYRIFAECYAHAARRVGVVPATFQAIVWCAWKERYPRMRKHALRKQW